jgi:integrase
VGSKESKTQQDGVLAKPRTLMSLSAISRNPLRERAQNLTGYGLKLLALTFVRPGTVQKAEWANFDLKAGLWVVPFKQLKMASQRKKAGASESDHIVPLSRQALALLRKLHAITGGSRYLFPGRQTNRTMSENTLNVALIALGYKSVHCAHGYRASASTILNKERVDCRRRFERSLIELQLDHQDQSVRAIYDRDDCLPERIQLMQFWADKIDGLRAGKEDKQAAWATVKTKRALA